MHLSMIVAALALQAPGAKPAPKPAPAAPSAPAAPAPKAEAPKGERWIADFDQAIEVAKKSGKDKYKDRDLVDKSDEAEEKPKKGFSKKGDADDDADEDAVDRHTKKRDGDGRKKKPAKAEDVGGDEAPTATGRTYGADVTATAPSPEPPMRDSYPISFYTNVKAKHAISRYEDLYGLNIGVIRSSAYFERFDQDHKLQKTFVTRETQLVDMLASQRLDVIVGIGANLDYLIHETGRSGVIKKSSFEIETKDPAYIAVSKKSKHKGIVPRLEKVLSDMRRANDIEQIERSFLEALARDKP